MAFSFERDIKPLFREFDVESMVPMGMDLWDYEQVKQEAEEIYERLADGSMACDEPWSEEKMQKFKQWMDEGMAP